jgi:hypothetical protein
VRGGDNRTGELFSYVGLEARVRRNHPLRAIRVIVNEACSPSAHLRHLWTYMDPARLQQVGCIRIAGHNC